MAEKKFSKVVDGKHSTNTVQDIATKIKFCEEMLATLKPCESLTKPRISCEKHSEGLK